MDKYGIIGYPLGHSFSPKIHNPAFKYLNIDAKYEIYPIEPISFETKIGELKAGDYCGFNVTVPFKQKIIPFIDVIDPQAQKVNAVNTIKKVAGKWHGSNTDLYGFLLPIQDDLKSIKNVLVLGAGGAANAVCFALLDSASIEYMTIANRTIENAEILKNRLSHYYKLPLKAIQLDIKVVDKYDLIVNTTSLGMGKTADKNPFDIKGCYHNDTIVYDLIYNPKETRLLKEAKRQKLKALNGLDMLIGQAAKSFFIWTGQQFPSHLIQKDIFYK